MKHTEVNIQPGHYPFKPETGTLPSQAKSKAGTTTSTRRCWTRIGEIDTIQPFEKNGVDEDCFG